MSYLHVSLNGCRRLVLWLVGCMVGVVALPTIAQTPSSLDTTPFPAFAMGKVKNPYLAVEAFRVARVPTLAAQCAKPTI
jgi:hypothetical protein